jgi:hypothetical protein
MAPELQRNEGSGRFAEKAKLGCVDFGYCAHPGFTSAIQEEYHGLVVDSEEEDPRGGFEEVAASPLWEQSQ